jgi:hypothetical protein
MRFVLVVCCAAALAGCALAGPAPAQNEKLFQALNIVQSEMSECVSYYANVKACVGSRDEKLSNTTQKTIDALLLIALKVGRSVEMTEDAMSRLKMFESQQDELIQHNCANMARRSPAMQLTAKRLSKTATRSWMNI